MTTIDKRLPYKATTYMKQFLFTSVLLALFTYIPCNDASILREISLKLEEAKKFLAIWEKNKDIDENLNKAIQVLKVAKDQLDTVKDAEDQAFAELSREVSMLYFWSNKSKRAIAVRDQKKDFVKYQKSVEEESVSTAPADTTTEANVVAEIQNAHKDDIENIHLPDDHPLIAASFKRAIEYSKNNPNHLFEIEFMYRDIYFDFPTSRSAEIATNFANAFSQKIDDRINAREDAIKSVKAKIKDYDLNYSRKNLGTIVNDLIDLHAKEKNPENKEYIREFILELKYIQAAVEGLDELIKLNKNNYPPSSFVGIQFRGSITAANEKGLVISTDMGSMITPWSKVSDEQLGKLLGFVTKGHKEISHKIAIAVHLLGNSIEAFELLYEKAIEEPTILAKHSEYYFQTLYHYRRHMKKVIDDEIARSQKMFDGKNVREAVSILTSCLLRVNKNNYLRDQIKNIHVQLAKFNR